MAHSPRSSAASVTLDSLLSQSPHQRTVVPAQCCCGRQQCAYLEHNSAALEGLEKDLQNAAQIGQALVARHETYMAEAEEERRRMNASIDKLETDKKQLEVINARTIDENRYLLDQLEGINSSVSDSDAQILSLNATLQSTRRELDRLTVLAAQTAHLERQLSNLEREHSDLQDQLSSTEEKERTAVQRWKSAERTISSLQEQIDRIEREAREEHARHEEVVTRLERRCIVERELENAAGRLKGAAAATTLGRNGGSSVVSQFVKDILQDNANLQLGIVELREMLMGSNDEVEKLREQMILHQPLPPPSDIAQHEKPPGGNFSKAPAGEAIPDLHVHHHYHAAPKVESPRGKVPSIRRPKRRNITTPGMRTPTSGTQTPRMPATHDLQTIQASSTAAIMSHPSISIPPSAQSLSQRWSTASSQAPSSLPSSTHSMSIFDSLDDNADYSRPTTPASTTIGSPTLQPQHFKQGSDVSIRSHMAQAGSNMPHSILGVLQSTQQQSQERDAGSSPLSEPEVIAEEIEDDMAGRSIIAGPVPCDGIQPMQPRLHRASSHDSMLSPRFIDIPKIRTRRSQILGGHGYGPRTSLGDTMAPITSSTAAIAHRFKRDQNYDSSNYNRLLLKNASLSPTSVEASTAEKSKLGNRVGGWMFGKWGVTPASTSSANLKAKEVLSAVGVRAAERSKGNSMTGERAEKRLSSHVEPVIVDNALLQESLGEP